MSILVCNVYQCDTEVEHVIYITDDKRKVISTMLGIIAPIEQAKLCKMKADRIYREVRSELVTYGHKAANELLEYYRIAEKQKRSIKNED